MVSLVILHFFKTSMLCMQGSANKEEARWYVGKRCAYVYKAKNKTSVPGQAEKSNLRCIWGKVSSTKLMSKQTINQHYTPW